MTNWFPRAKRIIASVSSLDTKRQSPPKTLDWSELQTIKSTHPVKQSNGEILPPGHYNPDDFAKAVQEAVLRKNKLL